VACAQVENTHKEASSKQACCMLHVTSKWREAEAENTASKVQAAARSQLAINQTNRIGYVGRLTGNSLYLGSGTAFDDVCLVRLASIPQPPVAKRNYQVGSALQVAAELVRSDIAHRGYS
jgi:hypothetical protein